MYRELALIFDGGDIPKRRVAPRDQGTTELTGGTHLVFEDAVRFGAPVGVGRKFAKRLAAVEGIQCLAGVEIPVDVILQIAPSLEQFVDDPGNGGTTIRSTYGPRLADQVIECEYQLKRDPYTRQAVVTMWEESDRNPRWKARPCTTEMQFLQRDDALEFYVFMRANDFIHGFAYDVFQFAQLQAAMAHVLDFNIGSYYHYASSLHVYDRDVSILDRVATAELDLPKMREPWGPPWWELKRREFRDLEDVQRVFRYIIEMLSEAYRSDPGDVIPLQLNPVEAWYWEALKPKEA